MLSWTSPLRCDDEIASGDSELMCGFYKDRCRHLCKVDKLMSHISRMDGNDGDVVSGWNVEVDWTRSVTRIYNGEILSMWKGVMVYENHSCFIVNSLNEWHVFYIDMHNIISTEVNKLCYDTIIRMVMWSFYNNSYFFHFIGGMTLQCLTLTYPKELSWKVSSTSELTMIGQ